MALIPLETACARPRRPRPPFRLPATSPSLAGTMKGNWKPNGTPCPRRRTTKCRSAMTRPLPTVGPTPRRRRNPRPPLPPAQRHEEMAACPRPRPQGNHQPVERPGGETGAVAARPNACSLRGPRGAGGRVRREVLAGTPLVPLCMVELIEILLDRP